MEAEIQGGASAAARSREEEEEARQEAAAELSTMSKRAESVTSAGVKEDVVSPGPEAGPSVQRRHRGPNPNTDYKMHFTRQKERFDIVSEDNTTRKRELTRASLKQLKLNDELEFLIDAIAGEMHRRRQIHQGQFGLDKAGKSVKAAKAKVQSAVGEDIEAPGPTQDGASPEAKSSLDDEELLALAEDDEDDEGDESDAGQPAKSAQQADSTARASARTSMKRQRSFSASPDTEDELLEAAGLSSPASKRVRT